MGVSALVSAFLVPIMAVWGIFYIFVLWVMWMIVKSLKSIDKSLQVIAVNTVPKA
jgi:hypothetical protein